MIQNTLAQLGLNTNEIAAYLQLLRIGSVPSSVIGRRTGMPRTTAKYTCEQLVQKGLVLASAKKGTVIYAARPPESLSSLLEREKYAIQEKEEGLQRILGDLKKIFNPTSTLPVVTFYEGADKIIEMLEDVIRDNQPLFGVFRIDNDLHPAVFDYLTGAYTKKRSLAGNEARMIVNDTPATREYRKKDSQVNRISLLVPNDIFPFEVCCHIYGSKIAFYSARSNDLTGVIIQNQYMRNTLYSIFKLAWNAARQIDENHSYRHVDLE